MSLHSNPGSAAIAGSASGIPAGIPPSKALALAQAPAARASSGPLSASAAAALAHRLASISLHTVGGQTPPASTEPPAPKTTSTPVTTTTPATATGKAGVSMVPRTTSSIDALLASTASPAAASAAAVPVPVPVAVSAADASDFGLLPMQSHFASIKDLLLNDSAESSAKLLALLKDRLLADMGETVFEIGIEDDGSSMHLSATEFATAVERLRVCANQLNSDAVVLHRRYTATLRTSTSAYDQESASGHPETPAAAATSAPTSPVAAWPASPATKPADGADAAVGGTPADAPAGSHNFGHVLVRRRAGSVENIIELRICVVGNVDAGKSTMLGVLTKDVLDDGRGKARVNLFRHKHEIESGRTSSVGMEMMGYDSTGRVVTPSLLGKPRISWDDICYNASKVITFLDLAGHEKYLKTTVFGMTGCSPDYVMLMVGANAGIIGMTKEHLGLALALQVPVYIVITKIDMCPKNVLESTINQLVKILKSPGCRKIPMFIRTIGDVITSSNNFISERVCPIFQVSNVSGDGLDHLRLFLNLLHANGSNKYDTSAPVEYQITDTFSVPGVGTVVSGTLVSGIVHVGDTLLLGPDSTGAFTPSTVKSIQRKRVSTPVAAAGQCASFGLKKIKRSALRKGMVLVSRGAPGDPPPRAVLEFDAEVLVLFHSTTIGEKYQAMVHCGGVRQTARIVGLDKRVLRTGDRAVVRFRFLQRPEYLKVGGRLLFREGRTKGLGKVVRLVSAEEVKAEAAARAAALAAAAAEKAAEKAGNSNSNSNSASAMTGSAASVAVQ